MDVWTVLLFLLIYALISFRALERWGLDRPLVAFAGAAIMVLAKRLTIAQAAGAVDVDTLVLLIGVMGMGAALAHGGLIRALERYLARYAEGPRQWLRFVVWGTGLSAACITNDAAVIFFTPIVVRQIQRAKWPALPFLLALATGANTGSIATLVGNPQNMLCAALGGLSFAHYLAVGVPLALMCLAANEWLLARMFRTPLRLAGLRDQMEQAEPPAGGHADSKAHTANATTTDDDELTEKKGSVHTGWALAVLVSTIIAYIAGAPMAWVAVAGFVGMVLVTRTRSADLWPRLDWGLIVFFIGLFVLVEALTVSGATARLHAWMPLPSTLGLPQAAHFSAFVVLGANLVSNVPFILLIKEQMALFPNAEHAWTLLAVVSTLAGNLTLLGSAANIIVAESSREVGSVGFWEHVRVGWLLTVGTIGFSIFYIHIFFNYLS